MKKQLKALLALLLSPEARPAEKLLWRVALGYLTVKLGVDAYNAAGK